MTKILGLKVEPGQVWEDNDPRNDPPRRVRVRSVEGGYATCDRARLVGPDDGIQQWCQLPGAVRIRLDRFRPTRSGYRLVAERAPAALWGDLC